MEVFSHLHSGQREGHEKVTPGLGGERIEGTKPYEFGDPVSELDLHQTLHNAMTRQGIGKSPQGKGKIKFTERDFELHLHEGTTSCLSGGAARYERVDDAVWAVFVGEEGGDGDAGNRLRSSFPQDSIDFVGVYSGGSEDTGDRTAQAMPKPVTVYDYQVRLKVPIDKLDKAPQHFTNLHMGLQLARRILRKRTSENKQLFIITDGQPTAHVENDFVYLLYPPDPRSTAATLKEAVLAAGDGCPNQRRLRRDPRITGAWIGLGSSISFRA